jgi:peptidoglycan/xylan/chitin deacetylase (PgdA/CDA1 family)
MGRRLARDGSRLLCRRPSRINGPVPMVSFTFDDFPRSAFLEGGCILGRSGARATYYVSLGLAAKKGPAGKMFLLDDLKALIEQGHELGCHTYGHCHSWDTPPDIYERSILKNRQALNDVFPGASFRTFAYPISMPALGTKRVASRHFLCCRGGGQRFNAGKVDLNNLSAFFLEKSRDHPEAVKALIDQNAQARGWLILATHDVCDRPSPYGCAPDFFDQVVRWSVESGARILPVVAALEALQRK